MSTFVTARKDPSCPVCRHPQSNPTGAGPSWWQCVKCAAHWDENVRVRPPVKDYGNVLEPFTQLMRKELRANSHKGNRSGWLTMSRENAVLEIYYHVGKLQKAARDNDPDGIREHAADVANMSMMLVDIFGLLVCP